MQGKALLNHGLHLMAQGDLLQAAAMFTQAGEENPNDSEIFNCLGNAQYNLRLFEEAELSLQRALELNPENPNALCTQSALFISTQRLEEAKVVLERLIRLCPDMPDAYNNLGSILMQEGNLTKSELLLRRAVELRPNYPSAYNNLGLTLTKKGLLIEAEAVLCLAIIQQPNFPEACNNLGNLLKEARRYEEALKYLYFAIKLNPNYAEAYNNLGAVLTDMAHSEIAETCLHHAIRIKPDYPVPYHNFGILFVNTHRLTEAEIHFKQALLLDPNYTDAEFALATLYLLQGRYSKGWEKYDKSRMLKHSFQPNIPRWNGENPAEKKLLLYHEQGFGDTLHFIRYAQWVEKLAGETVLWVQKPLQPLIASSFPALHVYGTEAVPPGEFDFCCPLPSLPKVFATSLQSIPRTIPYIKPCAEIIAKWDHLIPQQSRNDLYRVGVVWAGNPNHHNDCNRSIPFAVFNRLLEISDVSWISLQEGKRSEDLKAASVGIADFSSYLVDFAEAAGIIANLKLVITVDSAIAHLSGAMGKPTWLLLPYAPDWRWQLKKANSPWYPTLRLFRQNKSCDWSEVLARVKKALKLEKRNMELAAN